MSIASPVGHRLLPRSVIDCDTERVAGRRFQPFVRNTV